VTDTPEDDRPEDERDDDPETPRMSHAGPAVAIESEMRTSYLDYAMSVIVSRAIPDLRDGLKPVHRRILYAMQETGNTFDKAYRKSARPVGDVMGKYHPHGDQAIYDALVRMAQDFSMSLPLLDGQGNFGSMDGDKPAAMRYTEVRMAKAANYLLADIDKETVDFQPNYDGKDLEPTVLPARFPNMLVNGAGGIAVGMATNIPPHNLGEVVDATLALIANPELTVADLMEFVPAPDFPTGGLILGRSGARRAYHEGRGSVIIRARTRIEEVRGGRTAIIVSEIPYQVNKATMIERIAELAREKRIEGIAHVQDESDRFGVRVVVELRRDATPDVVLNQLFRFTPMQTSFGCNMLALNGGRPEVLDLKRFLTAFIAFREEVVARRTAYELRKARERAHVLCGLAVAVSNVDEVVATIRASADPADARDRLMARRWPAAEIAPYIALIDDPSHRINEDGTYNLSEEQARAILDLRLQRLTALGRDEIADELNKIGVEIADYLDILGSRARIQQIVKDELTALRDEFGTPRRTELTDGGADMEDEDLIQREDMVVTVTHGGYIKRVPLSIYRAQARGGKGRSGMSTRDEDFVTRLFVANTHTPVLFFSSRGIVYKEKVWRLPVGTPQARGKALINMLPIENGDRITAILPLPEDEGSWGELDVMFATTRGTVRRNKLSDFVQVNRNGKIAMKLDEGDEILNVETCTENDDVLLTANSGQCIRFPVTDVRVFAGRNSIGVRGISLGDSDRAISMTILGHVEASPAERAAYLKRSGAERRLAAGEGEEEEIALTNEDIGEETDLSEESYQYLKDHEQFVLTVTEFGYGKRSSTYDFRLTGRGGKGIRATDVSKVGEIGRLVATFPVANEDQIMLVSDGGTVIRVPVNHIRFASRATKGVTIFNTAEGEKVVSVERISEPNGEEEEDENGNGATEA
jgi:DNA gyrase subunit A